MAVLGAAPLNTEIERRSAAPDDILVYAVDAVE
jgi:hypothetical protein